MTGSDNGLPGGMAAEDRAHGSALAKGMAVLELVVDSRRPVGLVEMTERLGLPKPTVHRLVRQLEEEGLLQREPQRDRFSAGPRLRALALDTIGATVATGPVHAILESLVAQINETCNIGILDRTQVVYLDRVECDWPLRLQLRPNSRLPIHCTANGKLLLAMLEDRTRRRLIDNLNLQAFTVNTITDPGLLDEECSAIREQNFATNNQEFHLGLIGLAVPVRDGEGRVIAGLALHSPLQRMDLDGAQKHLPALCEAAIRMGEAMIESEDAGHGS
jgi:DNA-binding IclR family transcriptional regulator